jgi:hypothetical protein
MLACVQPVSGKGQPKQITNAINPCEASIPSFSHAAQRLRSTMRCSAYEGCQEGCGWSVRFFLSSSAGRAEQRNGAKSRALAVGFPIQREPAFLPRLRPVILSLKASGLFSFCSCALFARREFASLPDRCRRFVLCWPTCATHQLLSGQLRSNPTPNMSCLNDCGDRGVRPI